jgi:hypothetical protein
VNTDCLSGSCVSGRCGEPPQCYNKVRKQLSCSHAQSWYAAAALLADRVHVLLP